MKQALKKSTVNHRSMANDHLEINHTINSIIKCKLIDRELLNTSIYRGSIIL